MECGVNPGKNNAGTTLRNGPDHFQLQFGMKLLPEWVSWR